MDTLLSIKAEYRGTAALALQTEFFTTEPFGCDTSSLPQCPPSKEINAKKIENQGSRDRSYAHDRSVRAIPSAEANAELQKEKSAQKSYTQRSATPHQRNNQRSIRKEPIHDIKGKKEWLGPISDSSDKMYDLLREHDAMMIFKTATSVSLEKGSTAKGNDHDSKGKMSRSLGPSTSTNHQISTLLPEKWTNMQGLP
ncbi:hypothetical protein R3W88_019072 [Solanum pinnatisectum]|uniref:Uncharacterized protein n=1 Tax=Solanum pinnatisectum TaxID=50273 RepID=A0AAV9KL87_9SOLN|nr:hypothetical protein R3W88_019072 [Solanum pinnatisectum]